MFKSIAVLALLCIALCSAIPAPREKDTNVIKTSSMIHKNGLDDNGAKVETMVKKVKVVKTRETQDENNMETNEFLNSKEEKKVETREIKQEKDENKDKETREIKKEKDENKDKEIRELKQEKDENKDKETREIKKEKDEHKKENTRKLKTEKDGHKKQNIHKLKKEKDGHKKQNIHKLKKEKDEHKKLKTREINEERDEDKETREINEERDEDKETREINEEKHEDKDKEAREINEERDEDKETREINEERDEDKETREHNEEKHEDKDKETREINEETREVEKSEKKEEEKKKDDKKRQVRNSFPVKAVSFLHGVIMNERTQKPEDATFIIGEIRYIQQSMNSGVSMNVNISFIPPLANSVNGLHVHEFGINRIDENPSIVCASTGDHWNPSRSLHGLLDTLSSHEGDLGNVVTNSNGQAIAQLRSSKLQLVGDSSVIGRSVVLHAGRDDGGQGKPPQSSINGNAGVRIACGDIVLDR